MITAKSLKADIFAAYIASEAEVRKLAHANNELRGDLYMARSAPVLPLGKATHAAYYDYVRECKVAQRGQRVCTYKTYAQWSAA